MDCLEFRRRLAAEPLSRDLALHVHRGECTACAAAWERAQQAERELLDALAVPVPAGLTERILLAQATGERRQHMSRRRFALALAASLLVALAGGSLLWRQHDAHTLPALAVAHMPGEIHSLELTRPIGAQAIAAGFAVRGLHLRGPLPDNVTYVHDCPVGPYRTVHLVSRVDGTSVAVLYMPGKRAAATQDFRRGDWHGRVVPLQSGTLVMLTDRVGQHSFDRVADTVAQDWRVAIDGLGDVRVGQL
ncbi:MAG TPA: DUF3379 family protein [Rhodanobacter sp.]|nr:DUF3379 family protein [Rhodanobacter sp.]